MACQLKEVVKSLAPFKKRLQQVAVESTYNWYWLVDRLQALNYPVVLANLAGVEQYNGIKHADDTNDAFFVAELLRLRLHAWQLRNPDHVAADFSLLILSPWLASPAPT